ncbi:MAG: response regulator [Acidobacteriaceae bacterium]|jgi:two-component system chemotaxis response regulator CheY
MAYNILIVDDSPAMRRVVKRVVEICGVEVGNYLEAGNGIEALAQLRTQWVDLIMTDINMPEMDGEELLLEVRKDPNLASIPLLVVSTDRSDARIKQMLDLGADGYVSKPFLPAVLSEEMYRLLGGAPA